MSSNIPTREEIESRAYEIYVERGQEDGHDIEHWLAAEQELNALEAQASTAIAELQSRTAVAGQSR
jgi:hypothetical protein